MEEDNKSKFYWDKSRNLSTTQDSKDKRVPSYYVGDTYREGYYQARYVVEDFDCTYNVSTAITYCLRSKKKHDDGGIECLIKARNHLEFEIERLNKLHNK
jgi:hypothetical protein|tara:strand:+ start:2961 stop:3260 length:300 start_codon:yes stop_codon:yes gene_type:complete